MKTSTKNVIITGVFTICGSLITALCTRTVVTNNYKNQNSEIENDIANSGIEISDDEDSIKVMVNQLITEYSNFKSKNELLQDEILDLKIEINKLKNENNISDNIEVPESDQEQHITYLNNLPVFNCQYYNYGDWYATDLYEWSDTDKAADGNNYKNATHMAIYGSGGNAQIIVIDYLLNKNYKNLNGNFLLDELSKSTTSIATLNIYGDDDLIYTFENITGGLVPQNTGDIPVENINKLRFEFVSTQGELGNYNHYFGVVFYDTVLK